MSRAHHGAFGAVALDTPNREPFQQTPKPFRRKASGRFASSNDKSHPIDSGSQIAPNFAENQKFTEMPQTRDGRKSNLMGFPVQNGSKRLHLHAELPGDQREKSR